eukprot:35351_1
MNEDAHNSICNTIPYTPFFASNSIRKPKSYIENTNNRHTSANNINNSSNDNNPILTNPSANSNQPSLILSSDDANDSHKINKITHEVVAWLNAPTPNDKYIQPTDPSNPTRSKTYQIIPTFVLNAYNNYFNSSTFPLRIFIWCNHQITDDEQCGIHQILINNRNDRLCYTHYCLSPEIIQHQQRNHKRKNTRWSKRGDTIAMTNMIPNHRRNSCASKCDMCTQYMPPSTEHLMGFKITDQSYSKLITTKMKMISTAIINNTAINATQSKFASFNISPILSKTSPPFYSPIPLRFHPNTLPSIVQPKPTKSRLQSLNTSRNTTRTTRTQRPNKASEHNSSENSKLKTSTNHPHEQLIRTTEAKRRLHALHTYNDDRQSPTNELQRSKRTDTSTDGKSANNLNHQQMAEYEKALIEKELQHKIRAEYEQKMQHQQQIIEHKLLQMKQQIQSLKLSQSKTATDQIKPNHVAAMHNDLPTTDCKEEESIDMIDLNTSLTNECYPQEDHTLYKVLTEVQTLKSIITQRNNTESNVIQNTENKQDEQINPNRITQLPTPIKSALQSLNLNNAQQKAIVQSMEDYKAHLINMKEKKDNECSKCGRPNHQAKQCVFNPGHPKFRPDPRIPMEEQRDDMNRHIDIIKERNGSNSHQTTEDREYRDHSEYDEYSGDDLSYTFTIDAWEAFERKRHQNSQENDYRNNHYNDYDDNYPRYREEDTRARHNHRPNDRRNNNMSPYRYSLYHNNGNGGGGRGSRRRSENNKNRGRNKERNNYGRRRGRGRGYRGRNTRRRGCGGHYTDQWQRRRNRSNNQTIF